jgi:exosortase
MAGRSIGRKRLGSLLLFTATVLVLFRETVGDLVSLSLERDEYSYILAMPVLGAFMARSGRRGAASPGTGEAASRGSASSWAGPALVAVSVLALAAGHRAEASLEPIDFLAVRAFSGIALWTGGFALIYGAGALRSYAFPLCLLAGAVPTPPAILDAVVSLLQAGSAAATHGLFAAAGVPFVRDGYVFRLPGVVIEIAEECSGIRSGLSLLITGLLAGSLFLDRTWKRALLVLLMVPVAVVKNGLRITTLSLLAVYVDRSFLTDSALHRNGGILFFGLALVPLCVFISLLRKYPKGAAAKGVPKPAASRSLPAEKTPLGLP